ncbi:MAG: putative porin, partial [Marinirhabdus sp.]
MVKWSLFYVVLCFAMPALAQVDNLKKDTVTRTNTLPMPPPDLPQSKNSGVMGFGKKPPIALYKIVTAQRDTTHLDTALSIKKEYKFNYLRRDNFGLLPFSNVGQTYNALTFQFNKKNLKPLFAAQSHHYFYRHTDDIHYYNVPTPLTEIYFKTAFEQGQQLDAFFTVNTSEQFNFSMGYKGLRSLGQYQHILTSTGNFIFTTNYGTKNGRYRLRAHLAAQDNLNQENGGLAATSVPLFVDNDPEFEDRARLDVVFENGENKLEGLRFYGDMEYDIVRKKDSARHNALTLGTALSFEDKFYEWRQTTAVGAFGESFKNENLRTKTKLEDFNAKAYARFHHGFFGAIGAFINYNDYNYGYSSVLNLSLGSIVNRLKGNLLQAGANYKKTYRGFQLQGQGAVTLSGGFNASYLSAGAGFALDGENKVAAYVKLHSVAPNFNFLLNQSDYVNYNWQNNFNNVKTQELGFTL